MLFIIGTKENVAINFDVERKRILWMIQLKGRLDPALQCVAYMQEGLSDSSYQILLLFFKDCSKADRRNEELTR